MYLLEKDLKNVLITFLKSHHKMKQETAESETWVAEKSRWGQANSRQKPGLVWRNRKKISQITKDYFYLPFFLLIILWSYRKVFADSIWVQGIALWEWWVMIRFLL
jgi:hypothetical protein